MPQKAYRVDGHFRQGRIETPFSVEVLGADEAAASERVISTIGSRHRANRRLIAVSKVTPVAADQVQDPVVKHALAKGL